MNILISLCHNINIKDATVGQLSVIHSKNESVSGETKAQILTYVSYSLSHMPNIFKFPFKIVKQYNLSRETVNTNIVQASVKENRLWNTGSES